MIQSGISSQQLVRDPWSQDRLLRERAIALGLAIDTSTLKNYSSALNSYLSFARLHNFPVEPTPDTLSFYAVFMSHHIELRSVSTYLSGICQQLEPYFPNIRTTRQSPLVERIMKGCMRLKSAATKRKHALTVSDLSRVIADLSNSRDHDDLLFLAMLLTGFFALLRLGEMTFPNDTSLQNWRKISKRSTVTVTDDQYGFHLPSHKANRFYEGNQIIVKKKQYCNLDPLIHFQAYFSSRDNKFPLSTPLWLMANGAVPTRHFFISRLRHYFDCDVAGQSMRAGGATSLAEHGVPPSLIQLISRWSSDAFFIYI